MAETTPTAPNVLQPPTATAASTLAAQKQRVAEAVPNAFREQFSSLLAFRTQQRQGAWRNGYGLSASQYWAALGTNAISVATIASEFDAFLETVMPGCTAADSGVPSDYR